MPFGAFTREIHEAIAEKVPSDSLAKAGTHPPPCCCLSGASSRCLWLQLSIGLLSDNVWRDLQSEYGFNSGDLELRCLVGASEGRHFGQTGIDRCFLRVQYLLRRYRLPGKCLRLQLGDVVLWDEH